MLNNIVRGSVFLNNIVPIHAYWDPIKVTIAITTHCNLKCVVCPRTIRSIENMHMSEEVFLKASAYFHGKTINILGIGEPFMHPGIFDFLRICKSSNVHLTTNGTLLNEHRTKTLLQHPNLKELAFSIDGVADSYDKVRINGNFSTVIDNLKRISSSRKRYPIITVNFVGMRSNIGDLPKLIDLLGKYVDKFHIIHPVADSELVALDHLNQDIVYATKMFNESISIARKHNVKIELPHLGPRARGCIYPWSVPNIGIKGNVYPCHMLSEIFNPMIQFYNHYSMANVGNYSLGNIMDTDFNLMWNGNRIKWLRRYLKKVNIANSTNYNRVLESNPIIYCAICPNRWDSAC
jgi:MoaA/NifB/PqqE/SkfB family radical SAM enzyme